MLFALLHFLRHFVSVIFVQNEVSLVEFCSLAEQHFAGQRTLTPAGWNESLPTAAEKEQMAELVTRIYSLTDFDHFDHYWLNDFPELEHKVNVTRIQNYIVIHEPFPPTSEGLFHRNWGLLAIADPTFSTRSLHHSAVHFDSEGPIYEEAAHVCQETKSRSLALHGASRYAIKGSSRSRCQPKYTACDGAHTTDTMFHLWSSVLLELSEERNEDYVFVQWHGMAETSCSSADVFASAGSKSASVYEDNSPAMKITRVFNRLSEDLKCATPKTDPSCRLVASDNPLGRLINGVKPKELCNRKAQDTGVQGRFLHVEQKDGPRRALDLWVDVVNEVFPADEKIVYREKKKTELIRRI